VIIHSGRLPFGLTDIEKGPVLANRAFFFAVEVAEEVFDVSCGAVVSGMPGAPRLL
jgi:hypothetical protein